MCVLLQHSAAASGADGDTKSTRWQNALHVLFRRDQHQHNSSNGRSNKTIACQHQPCTRFMAACYTTRWIPRNRCRRSLHCFRSQRVAAHGRSLDVTSPNCRARKMPIRSSIFTLSATKLVLLGAFLWHLRMRGRWHSILCVTWR